MANRRSLPAGARWGIPAFVAAIAIAVFLPALGNGFVNWDDEKNFLENSHYRGLGWANLRWMFTTFHLGHYQPLSWLTLALDHAVSGMDPMGYHATNLLLHGANAVLVYFLVLALLRSALGPSGRPSESRLRAVAAAGALLFAIHPLRVESVAWATERRDVLAGFFVLLSVLLYLRRSLVPSLACFALSLLSKAWGVTLPVVLLVLDAYPLRRFARPSPERRSKVLLEKVPYLVLALGAAALAPLAQREAEAMRSLGEHGLFERAAQAAFGLVFYLGKTALPIRLSPLYELGPRLDATEARFVVSILAIAAITIALLSGRRRWPAGLAAWTVYAIVLAPVLGFFQSGPQIAADRYTYLACIPFAALAAAGLARIERRLAAAASLAVLATLAVLSWKQTGVWKDSVGLWTHAVRLDPKSHVAQANLGTSFDEAGRIDEAIERYRAALALRPGDLKTRHSLGLAFAKKQAYERAIETWKGLLSIRPDDAEALYCIGLSSARLGREDDAIRAYEEAVRVEPRYADARSNLGELYAKRGRGEDAIAQWEAAIAASPGHRAARNNLGLAWLERGRLADAETQFRSSLRESGEDPDTLNNLGAVLSRMGRGSEAVHLFRRALALDPNHERARRNLENVAPEGVKPAGPRSPR